MLLTFKLCKWVDIDKVLSTDTLKERITWLDEVCNRIRMFKKQVDASDFTVILNAMETFYENGNPENVYINKDTYVSLLDCLHCIVTYNVENDPFENINSLELTQRFLQLTEGSKNSNLNPSNNESNLPSCSGCICSYYVPPKLVTGDNVLHISCREITSLSSSFYKKLFDKDGEDLMTTLVRRQKNVDAQNRFDKNMSVVSSKVGKGLATLLMVLHRCGENVNAQNSDGQTPLQALLGDNCVMRDGRSLKHSEWCLDFTPAVRSILLAGANPDLRDNNQSTSLHAAMTGYANLFEMFEPSDIDLKSPNCTIEILLKSGANVTARDSRGFTPLHVLMDEIFRDGKGFHPNLVARYGDRFAYHLKMLIELVRTVQCYGGCVHATTNDGRTVLDMCKDEDLRTEMSTNIPVTSAHLDLSRLAAAAIRIHQLQYNDKLPVKLVQLVEMRD